MRIEAEEVLNTVRIWLKSKTYVTKGMVEKLGKDHALTQNEINVIWEAAERVQSLNF